MAGVYSIGKLLAAMAKDGAIGLYIEDLDVPILVLSALVGSTIASEAGANDVARKPPEMHWLMMTIGRLLPDRPISK